MRVISLLILTAVAAVVVIFVVQNTGSVSIAFLNQQVTAPVAGVIAAAYVLGMLSGWSVLGLLRRSVHRVTDAHEHDRARAY
jgi:uncharacterized integral membrane protein